jgi:Inositol-pentakisphosphate 2-kinase
MLCHAVVAAACQLCQPIAPVDSGLPTLCVELKPKWGCLPSAATIHPDNRLKRQKSKFQLQQNLKLAEAS